MPERSLIISTSTSGYLIRSHWTRSVKQPTGEVTTLGSGLTTTPGFRKSFLHVPARPECDIKLSHGGCEPRFSHNSSLGGYLIKGFIKVISRNGWHHFFYTILEGGEDLISSGDGDPFPRLNLERKKKCISQERHPDIKAERTLIYLMTRSSTMIAKRLVLTPNPTWVKSRSRPRPVDHVALVSVNVKIYKIG